MENQPNTHMYFWLRFCILQAIKNWSWGRPGNEAMCVCMCVVCVCVCVRVCVCVCGLVHVVRFTRPSGSVFAYYKRSKTGAGEGLGTRLGM